MSPSETNAETSLLYYDPPTSCPTNVLETIYSLLLFCKYENFMMAKELAPSVKALVKPEDQLRPTY